MPPLCIIRPHYRTLRDVLNICLSQYFKNITATVQKLGAKNSVVSMIHSPFTVRKLFDYHQLEEYRYHVLFIWNTTMTNMCFLSKPTDGTLISVNLCSGLIYHENIWSNYVKICLFPKKLVSSACQQTEQFKTW